MAPALTSKTLEKVGVPPVGCTFVPSISPVTALPLISTYGNPCPMASRCVVVWGSPRLVWLLWELWQLGITLSAHPLLWPLSLALLGAQAGLLPYPALVRAAISLAILLPLFCSSLSRLSGHCSPGSYFVPDLIIFAFCLLEATINCM